MNDALASRTAAKLHRLSALRPTLGLILGSGFARSLDGFEAETRMAYRRLPGFPVPRVSGHAGELLIGRLDGAPVLILSGRSHYYEGHSLQEVTFPIRVLAAFGIRDLLLTNAAGGIGSHLRPGDFMSVSDHINCIGQNPLRGPEAGGGTGFVDLTRAYDGALRKLLARAARKARLKLRAGVYIAVPGPSYETPAEIRAFARLGADAVGMSTVPEVIVARQCGLRVAALSCITNLAAGRSRAGISHREVLATGERVRIAAGRLLRAFVELHGGGLDASAITTETGGGKNP